ncbi:MAG TPA: electron transfer flavoprotein subunit alpha/FixB family protein [Dehalococcoidia bacterium]|nr:electron transfer flavoprotein subunit alpha/FixB family protein [Dehalococcoidia bacterium]
MSGILVVAEHRNRALANVSYQVLSKGRQLADQAQMELLAVVAGSDVDAYAKELAGWADRVLAVKSDRLEGLLAEPCQKIIAHLIRKIKPKITLMGHSSFAMDMAPSLSVELGIPLATDCIDIFWQNGDILVTRSIYNSKVNATYSFAQSETVLITGRVGEFSVEEGGRQGQIEEIEFDFEEESDYKKFEGYLEAEAGGVDITQAEVLVSVGRGIKDKKNLEMVEELARVLGGVVSCSRPVVDYGWLPSERQVGLSGKTVQPKLYLGLGISGAFQHVVGMKGASIIVAINKDAKAPIFSVANYGIVDDLLKVVPALVNKISELKGKTE